MRLIKKLPTLLILTGFLFSTSFLTSCSDDDEEVQLAPSEQIVGTWVINESFILGSTIPGDGSTITFNACGETECTGSDFLASDESTSTLTYELNEEATLLTITDNDGSKGGSYSGEWTVESITNSSLTISAETFLGIVRFKMTKQ